MCGIFGYIGDDQRAGEIVLEGLKQLEYRGYDSWGVALAPVGDGGQIAVKKKTGKIGQGSVADMPSGSLAFGHTRWATHGSVTDANAHPHLDCTGMIALVHNGIFENYGEIKEELLRLGHTMVSETDSEVAVHLIEELAKTMPFPQAVSVAFSQMQGKNALIVFQANIRHIYALTSGSPLVVGFGEHGNFLASDPSALLDHTKVVHFLEENEMAVLSDTGIIISDISSGQEKTITKQTLVWSTAQTKKGDYDFFMEKEMYEQPGIVERIAVEGNSQIKSLVQKIHTSSDVRLIGCGTALYAAMVGKYLLATIGKKEVRADAGSEFHTSLPFVTEKTLILALSQSGESMDVLEPVREAKKKGAAIAALVNVLGSSLYRIADENVLIGAGPEKAVASTKDFTGKLAYLFLLAYSLAGKAKQGEEMLRKAADTTREVLSEEGSKRIQTVVQYLRGAEDIYIIGRGVSYPLSLETALKIKEISYIHAEGFASGELKHGPLALIEPGTPCIVYLPNDGTYAENVSSAMELKARGALVIGISFKPLPLFDLYLPVRDAGIATIIPNVVVAQMLAYWLARDRNLDPDMPRNLAKSVTVK